MNFWPCPLCRKPIHHKDGHQFDPLGTLHNYTCEGYRDTCEHGNTGDCLLCFKQDEDAKKGRVGATHMATTAGWSGD